MNLFDAALAAARWWFVTLPLMLGVGVVAVSLPANLQPEYVSRTMVLLAGPTSRSVDDGSGSTEPINPLVEQSNALLTAAVVASLSVEGAEVRQILADEGLVTTYDVEVNDRTPILVIGVRAPSRQLATDTALRLTVLVESHIALRQDQAKIPLDERVTARLLGTGSVGGADYGGRLRLRVLLVGFGAVLSLTAAFVLDAIRRRYGPPSRVDARNSAGRSVAHARV